MRYIAVLLLLGVAAPAQATTLRRLSLEELARDADLVVLARVGSRVSFWREGRILTRSTLAIDEVLAGGAAPAGPVEVITLGGVVGDIGQRVDGAAVLPQGPRLVLCLTRAPTGTYHVVGMAQGAFTLEPQPGEPERLLRPLQGARLVGPELAAPLPQTLPELRRALEELDRAR